MRLTRRSLAAIPFALSLPAVSRAQDAGLLTIYNAQHASLAREWTDAFTRETGIRTTIRNGNDTELGNQLVQEGARSPADVFLTENSPAMTLVDRAGLFAPLAAETLAEVDEGFRPAHGRWTGIAARSTVFAYNPSLLPEAELPASLADLAQPAWRGRWGASPAGADFQAIVSALLALRGEEETFTWLQAMKANATAYRGNGNVLRAVNAGQIPGGVIYHYYWFGDQARTGENSNNTRLHYFRNRDPGAFLSISGGGVLASSARIPQAQAFLRWLAGPRGQDILRTGTSYEYAVGRGQASHPRLVPIAELQVPRVEPADLNSARVTELMTRAGLI